MSLYFSFNLGLFAEVIALILFTIIVMFLSGLIAILFPDKEFSMKKSFSSHDKTSIGVLMLLEFFVWIWIIYTMYQFVAGELDVEAFLELMLFELAPIYIGFLGCKFLVFNLIGYVEGEDI